MPRYRSTARPRSGGRAVFATARSRGLLTTPRDASWLFDIGLLDFRAAFRHKSAYAWAVAAAKGRGFPSPRLVVPTGPDEPLAPSSPRGRPCSSRGRRPPKLNPQGTHGRPTSGSRPVPRAARLDPTFGTSVPRSRSGQAAMESIRRSRKPRSRQRARRPRARPGEPEPSPLAGGHWPELDLLRALACACMVLNHVAVKSPGSRHRRSSPPRSSPGASRRSSSISPRGSVTGSSR